MIRAAMIMTINAKRLLVFHGEGRHYPRRIKVYKWENREKKLYVS